MEKSDKKVDIKNKTFTVPPAPPNTPTRRGPANNSPIIKKSEFILKFG